VVFVPLFAIGVLGMSVIAVLCPAILKEAVMGRPTTFRALWRTSVRPAPAVAGALSLSDLIAGSPVFAILAVWLPLVVSAGSKDGAIALLGLLSLPMLAAMPLAVWPSGRLAVWPSGRLAHHTVRPGLGRRGHGRRRHPGRRRTPGRRRRDS
jgi:hypothetical protein